MAEERKAAPLAFRNDQLVIVFDDLSPRAEDLWSPRSKKFADAAQIEQFTRLVQDFPRMISAIDTYRLPEHTASLLPVPLSQWIESRRGQRPTLHNTPLTAIFVLFFFWDQRDNDDKALDQARLFSSTSVTGTVIEQVAQLANTHAHNVLPVDFNRANASIPSTVMCLSKRALQPPFDLQIRIRFNLIREQLVRQGLPASVHVESPVCMHVSTTLALGDVVYCNLTIKGQWLRRVFPTVFFHTGHVREAATLSSIVSHGLSGSNTPLSQFMTRGVYDPRLFMHIWYFLTGDTMPGQRDEKRKRGDGDDDDDD